MSISSTAEFRREAAGDLLPRCHTCDKTEGVAGLVWCDAPACNHYVCEDCATQTLWELEACSDECGQTITARLMKTVHTLRSEIRAISIAERRAA